MLVHYKELKRTTNSGRLIEKTLENQKIWVRGRLGEPLDHGMILKPGHRPLMLYPSEDAAVLDINWLTEYKMQNPGDEPFQLLIPDGNWRQASKVHYRVEELKAVPRVTLPPNLSDTDDLLRLETKTNGMSTLEAIGHALGVLDDLRIRDHLLGAYRMKKAAVLKGRGSK